MPSCALLKELETSFAVVWCCVLCSAQALQAAIDVEPLLMGAIEAAAPGCHHAAARDTLGE